MSRFAFDETRHVYLIDGQPVPSVTQIITAAGLSVDYAAADPAVLAHARDRGIYVEQCCRLWDEGRLDIARVVDEALPYLTAWQTFCREQEFVAVAHQEAVFHPTWMYAGTRDVRGMLGGKTALLDIKCTSSLSPSYRLQTAAYNATGLYDLRGDLYAPVNLRGVVQLKKNGTYVFERHENEEDYLVFAAALRIARWKAAV